MNCALLHLRWIVPGMVEYDYTLVCASHTSALDIVHLEFAGFPATDGLLVCCADLFAHVSNIYCMASLGPKERPTRSFRFGTSRRGLRGRCLGTGWGSLRAFQALSCAPGLRHLSQCL